MLDGIRERLGAVRVLSAEGCRITDPDTGDPLANLFNFNPRVPDAWPGRKRFAEAVG